MLDWLANRWNDFIDFMWQLVLSVFDMLKDFFIWVLEQLMDLVILALDGLDALVSGLDIASYFSIIPPETAYMLSQIGISQALGIIVTALTIRFILQLIPFVRLGS